MPCLLDTSKFNWLFKYRLYDEALAVHRIKRDDLLVLRELKFQLEDNKDARGQPVLDQHTLGIARKFCDGLKTIPSMPNESHDRRLLNTRNDNIWHEVRRVKIDGGEANIF